MSIKTIQRRLDKVVIQKQLPKPFQTVVMMDTTYFGRNFGVMVFKSTNGDNLYWKYVKYETVSGYIEGLKHLEAQGIQIQGVVCDGRKGLFNALSKYPVQMCQFHQIAIITRYITRKSKLLALIELKRLMGLLVRTDKESFVGALNDWYIRWNEFINERAINKETGKSRYIHKRLRSAYKSLERNKEYLFTWYDQVNLELPNTNNLLEGSFTDLKNKLRNHNGLSRKRKEKFIDGFLKGFPPGIIDK